MSDTIFRRRSLAVSSRPRWLRFSTAGHTSPDLMIERGGKEEARQAYRRYVDDASDADNKAISLKTGWYYRFVFSDMARRQGGSEAGVPVPGWKSHGLVDPVVTRYQGG